MMPGGPIVSIPLKTRAAGMPERYQSGEDRILGPDCKRRLYGA